MSRWVRVFMLTLSVFVLAGCGSEPSILNDAGRASSIYITDNNDNPHSWNPKQTNAVLNQIRTWLDNSKQVDFTAVKSNGGTIEYLGPSRLHLQLQKTERQIVIYPSYSIYCSTVNNQDGEACSPEYRDDILEVVDGTKVEFIENSSLYNWLKNNQWKPEFKEITS